MFLLLAVLHAPTPAQAVVYSIFPDLGSSEPVTLFLTGVALLSMARVGITRHR
jgi:hypothetical protein